MKVTETIFDIITQETTIVERELSKKEITEREAAAKAEAQREAEAEAKATARAEILNRLGLTADEAAILLA